MIISIIAAIGKNRELGRDNKLLWHIPEDLKRFKKLTEGHAVIMGRKTYESLGRPLPNRLNIVVTRDKNYKCYNCYKASSLEEAIKSAKVLSIKYQVSSIKYKKIKTDEIFIIGGGQIYEQAIKMADKLYLTIVDASFPADTFFPDYSDFKQVIYQKINKSEKFKYTFIVLKK